jgi:hypothetical protein
MLRSYCCLSVWPGLVKRGSGVGGCYTSLQGGADTVGQCLAWGLYGVVVGGDCWLVVGEDAVDEVGSFAAVAAAREVGVAGFDLAVFVIAGGALVEVGGVGVAGAGHRNIEHCAAGVFAEHGVARVGGNTLGGHDCLGERQ